MKKGTIEDARFRIGDLRNKDIQQNWISWTKTRMNNPMPKVLGNTWNQYFTDPIECSLLSWKDIKPVNSSIMKDHYDAYNHCNYRPPFINSIFCSHYLLPEKLSAFKQPNQNQSSQSTTTPTLFYIWRWLTDQPSSLQHHHRHHNHLQNAKWTTDYVTQFIQYVH